MGTKTHSELIGGVVYRVTVVTNAKQGKTTTLRLVYCGGSIITEFGRFCGVWASRHPDHRKVTYHHYLNIRGIDPDAEVL